MEDLPISQFKKKTLKPTLAEEGAAPLERHTGRRRTRCERPLNGPITCRAGLGTCARSLPATWLEGTIFVNKIAFFSISIVSWIAWRITRGASCDQGTSFAALPFIAARAALAVRRPHTRSACTIRHQVLQGTALRVLQPSCVHSIQLLVGHCMINLLTVVLVVALMVKNV